MFTINQIKDAHAQVKSGADFPQYAQALKALGLVGYDLYVADGHAHYYGADHFELASEAQYASLSIAAKGSTEAVAHGVRIHQQGQTDYLTFCQQVAQAGVEKWTIDLVNGACTYYDQAGLALLVEAIPAG